MKKLLLSFLVLMLGFTMSVNAAAVKFNYIMNGYVTDPSTGSICPAAITYYFSKSTPFGVLNGADGPNTVNINNSLTIGGASGAFDESFTIYVPCRNLTYSVTMAELTGITGGYISKLSPGSSVMMFVQKVTTNEYNLFFQSPLGG